ncbi:MAG TPA: TonB-dependent receptor [Bryobacteraceae bacterium]|nr:TonB-dependent receptor [Bryobacteraceae bacterium]
MKLTTFHTIAALLLAAVIASGQNTSQQISGSLRDSSGAGVPDALVTAVQMATGLSRQTTASGTGYFVLTNIPIGAYEVTVEAKGFQKYVQKNLNVGVNDKVQIDATLTVGSLSESVTVSADAAMIEASSGEIGRVVSGQQATQLQLNGRNYTQLLSLLPGVSTNNRSNFDLAAGYGAAVTNQSVNGGRTGTLSVYVDGSDNLATGGGGHSFVNINPDAVAEVKVLTSNYSAEYGQSSGAVMNVALKSGTRGFHGSFYEFARNSAFDARAFGASKKQKLTFNNFGWNLGGPLYIPGKLDKLRDKLFFFTGMDFKRLRRGNPTIWNVPLPAQKRGDFSALPASQWPLDVTTGQPFAGGVIPASRISPNGSRLVGNYPNPNFSGPGGNYNFEYSYPMNVNEYIGKIDYLLTSNHQFSWTYVHDDYRSLENLTSLVTYWRTIPGTNQSGKWTWVVDPMTVNSFQISVPGHHIYQGEFAPNPLFITDYSRSGRGITYPMLFGSNGSIPSLNITGYTGLNVTPTIWNNSNRIIFFKEDISKVSGAHTLKAGFFYQRNRKNQDNQPAVNGSFSFGPGHPLYSGNPLADALLGNFNSYTEANGGREGWFRFTQVEFYLADNWKVKRRLSLDLGVRVNYMPQQYSPLQNTSFFSPRYFDPAKAPQIRPSDGQIVPGTGDPVNGLVVGGSSYPSALTRRFPGTDAPEFQRALRGVPVEISPTYWPVGPRFGFAYDLTGRQTTVLRGGYGMVFERVQGNFIFSQINNPPFVRQATLYTANIEDPSGGSLRPAPASLTSFDLNVKIPTVHNYSFSMQRKLGKNTLLDMAYVGSAGWNLYRGLNLNQLPAGTLQRNPGVNTNALRPYLGYADITQYITGSNYNYNSLQIQARKQFAGGGLVNMAYTWSKSITDASSWGEQPMDSYNFKRERGLASFDRRHILMLSYVYPIPFWQRQDRWYKVALGGWQLSGITSLESGLPLNVTIQGDRAGTGTGNQRPDVVGDPMAVNRSISQWFNTSAFTLPAVGTFGNLGRNALIGPGVNNWDVSAQKFFRLTERFRVEFRAEMFNAPNHLSYWSVATTVGAANFGQVTNAMDPRNLQFALKVLF